MPRVIFSPNTQAQFLRKVKVASKLTNSKLAYLCGVSSRTFRDWLREKFTPSQSAVMLLSKKFSIPLPTDIQIVGDYWYGIKGSRKGALKRMQLYGPLGTPEGRRKGGLVSQLRRKENPEKYKLLNCNLKKVFNLKPSIELAEATGIILGDGCITNTQVKVSVSRLVDYLYARYIQSLFLRVFGEAPSFSTYQGRNVINLTLSGVGLIEEFKKLGLVTGNKVRQQVVVPAWIWRRIEFRKACLRGLFDTDGGLYFHRHKSNCLVYKNLGWSFRNHSRPLVEAVAQVLKSLGIKHSISHKGASVYIYSLEDIKRYFNVVGSHNPKNQEKLDYYLSQATHRVYGEVA